MPNTTVYMDNETYIGFLKLDSHVRKELRESFVKEIQTVLKKRKK